jgi:hypothetical protein
MLWKLRTLDARAKTDMLFVFVGYRLCIRHALPSGHEGQSVTTYMYKCVYVQPGVTTRVYG